MLTHVYADAAVPASDADLLLALIKAARGLARAGASRAGGGSVLALRFSGQVYRIVVCEGDAQTRAIHEVLAWFGCQKVVAEPRPGFDDEFEVPATSPCRLSGRLGRPASAKRR